MKSAAVHTNNAVAEPSGEESKISVQTTTFEKGVAEKIYSKFKLDDVFLCTIL